MYTHCLKQDTIYDAFQEDMKNTILNWATFGDAVPLYSIMACRTSPLDVFTDEYIDSIVDDQARRSPNHLPIMKIQDPHPKKDIDKKIWSDINKDARHLYHDKNTIPQLITLLNFLLSDKTKYVDAIWKNILETPPEDRHSSIKYEDIFFVDLYDIENGDTLFKVAPRGDMMININHEILSPVNNNLLVRRILKNTKREFSNSTLSFESRWIPAPIYLSQMHHSLNVNLETTPPKELQSIRRSLYSDVMCCFFRKAMDNYKSNFWGDTKVYTIFSFANEKNAPQFKRMIHSCICSLTNKVLSDFSNIVKDLDSYVSHKKIFINRIYNFFNRAYGSESALNDLLFCDLNGSNKKKFRVSLFGTAIHKGLFEEYTKPITGNYKNS